MSANPRKNSPVTSNSSITSDTWYIAPSPLDGRHVLRQMALAPHDDARVDEKPAVSYFHLHDVHRPRRRPGDVLPGRLVHRSVARADEKALAFHPRHGAAQMRAAPVQGQHAFRQARNVKAAVANPRHR